MFCLSMFSLAPVIRCIYFHFFYCANSPWGESSHTFLKSKQTNYFYPGKTKQKYPWKWFVKRMMFTIHQKRFSFLKKTLISFFYKWSEPSRVEPSRSKNGSGANRPGRNWFWSEPSRNRPRNIKETVLLIGISNVRFLSARYIAGENLILRVAKTKALISFAVTADLRLCFRTCKKPVFS